MSEKITIGEIIDVMCEIAGVERWQMLSERRHRRTTRARQAAMWLAHRATGKSYPTIGRAFNRDHTTVMHAVKVFESRTSEAERNDLLAEVHALAALGFEPHPLSGVSPIREPLVITELLDADERAERREIKRCERKLLAALMREHPDKYQPVERAG